MKKLMLGVTLIELLLVIVIGSILGAASVSFYSGNSINLGAEIQAIATDIRYTQTLARTRGKPMYIEFGNGTPYGTYYRLFEGNGTPVPHPATNTADVPVDRGMSITTAPTRITFDRFGEPSFTPGGSKTVTVTGNDGNNLSLTVTDYTGNIKLP